ncbi:MAG: ATP-dependent DNA ligase [Verrucomicrobia bacterium]|nr:ATP-dependent DNA ligase [Verrucomicrobiota bacterium]
MAWDVQYRNGLWLPQIGWWLDAHFPTPRSFVSHAHFDHLAAHGEVLCSEGTARLMQARLPAARAYRTVSFGETIPLDRGATLTLHPAGHIFGSAQCLIAHPEHGRLLYTGDFKLRPGLSAEPCATPAADLLIMETTYGRPQYVFPPTATVLADIRRFCREALQEGETPVLFGYSLGKSQELLSVLTQDGLPVMLHPQTARMTAVYEELGVRFPAYRTFDEAEAPGHVVLCPPQSPQSAFLRRLPRRRTATITGWALDPSIRFRSGCDAAFPLSDHADFPDLLRMVECVQPRRVLTLHGFAADFARTLRERGFDAWAINEDNQLEMALHEPAPSPTARPPSSAPERPAAAPTAGRVEEDTTDFGRFAATAEALRTLTGRTDKVALLAEYFRSLPTPEAALATRYFTARPLARADERTLQVGWSLIRRAVLEVAGATPDDFRRAYLRFGDSGETAEALLGGRVEPRPLGLRDVGELFDRLARSAGPAAKLALLESCFRALSPDQTKYVIKILTGDLRIGLREGLVEEAIAASTAVPIEAVRDAVMINGDLGEVLAATRAGTLGTLEAALYQPIGFMLASPEPDAGAIITRLGTPVWIEEKYDGIRCQLHTAPGRAELFSRDLRRISDQFPELVAAARELGTTAIIDGELLAWRDGRALPFAELQRRLGRKGDDLFLGAEIPVSLSCYDLLRVGDESLLRLSLAERRARLEALLAERADRRSIPALQLAPVRRAHSAEEIELAFAAARRRGNEGLMAKNPTSPYTPGRRGLAWLKLKKAAATLDVVVVAVETGHGKRKAVLSDYTFAVRDDDSDRLLTVGKAYSGLTDAEIARLTDHFLDRTLEVQGRRRTVVPDLVLEVAFDAIQPSPRHDSGFALRFPRIVRIRDDKTVADIDRLSTCRTLAAAAVDWNRPADLLPGLDAGGGSSQTSD